MTAMTSWLWTIIIIIIQRKQILLRFGTNQREREKQVFRLVGELCVISFSFRRLFATLMLSLYLLLLCRFTFSLKYYYWTLDIFRFAFAKEKKRKKIGSETTTSAAAAANERVQIVCHTQNDYLFAQAIDRKRITVAKNTIVTFLLPNELRLKRSSWLDFDFEHERHGTETTSTTTIFEMAFCRCRRRWYLHSF